MALHKLCRCTGAAGRSKHCASSLLALVLIAYCRDLTAGGRLVSEHRYTRECVLCHRPLVCSSLSSAKRCLTPLSGMPGSTQVSIAARSHVAPLSRRSRLAKSTRRRGHRGRLWDSAVYGGSVRHAQAARCGNAALPRPARLCGAELHVRANGRRRERFTRMHSATVRRGNGARRGMCGAPLCGSSARATAPWRASHRLGAAHEGAEAAPREAGARGEARGGRGGPARGDGEPSVARRERGQS